MVNRTGKLFLRSAQRACDLERTPTTVFMVVFIHLRFQITTTSGTGGTSKQCTSRNPVFTVCQPQLGTTMN